MTTLIMRTLVAYVSQVLFSPGRAAALPERSREGRSFAAANDAKWLDPLRLRRCSLPRTIAATSAWGSNAPSTRRVSRRASRLDRPPEATFPAYVLGKAPLGAHETQDAIEGLRVIARETGTVIVAAPPSCAMDARIMPPS